MPFPKETSNIEHHHVNELEKVSAMIQELDNALRRQRELLHQRGMGLPHGTLQNIGLVKDGIAEIATDLAAQQVEQNRLYALAETSALINSTLGLENVLNHVMDTVIALTGAERGYIVLRDESSGELAFMVARNLDHETIERGTFVVSRSIVNNVAESGEPIITTNAQNDPRFAGQESIASFTLRSIICVPLMVKDTVTGVVYADNHIRAGLFDTPELILVDAFANQAAVAIENARLFEEVKSTLEDITENKDLLDKVFASIASGVITTDTTGQIIVWNKATETILDIPENDALNQSIEALLPQLGESFFESLSRTAENGTDEALEIAVPTKTRGKIVLTIRMTPLRTTENAIRGVTILIDDLTEIRRREETLAEVRRYLPPAMVENIRAIDNIELGGEEREISVIFADIRGFTGFSERLQPEALMGVINRYLGVCTEAIQLYDGIIDKYMGDAVIGIYNTQLNPQKNDHALRAVRAALSMIYDVKALHEMLPPELELWYGIGIDTGHAVLGNVGSEDRKEFTALGHAVNHAKQLQEIAEPGEIIISQATFDRVQNAIEAERIERSFRGDDEPQVMYRIVGFKRRR